MSKICIIDDEANIRKTLREILEDESYEVVVAEDGQQGLNVIRDEQPDVVLLDIQLPDKDGLTVLSEIKAQKSGAEVIMISGHGTIEMAVTAIKQGAFHFLQKPLALVEVKHMVHLAVQTKCQRDELKDLHERDDKRFEMVGISAGIQRLKREIDQIAPSPGRVLIRGESGTGKELVAYAIYKKSARANAPFVKVNCAAIPQNLIESELFGHEKGSFTGAVAQKKGKFECAHTGTLFLDEIGDMDLPTQTKVLRAIQEGEFERVGGTKTLKVDVRIIAATHRNLEEMLAAGTFREDLYYRLTVLPVKVPSLDERAEDVPLLADYFLDLYCAENNISPKRFLPDARTIIASRKYPGNIRQLRNIIERAAILSTTAEISADFMTGMLEGTGDQNKNALFLVPRTLAVAKDELERMFVKTQLDQNNWNIPKTAEILGIERTNLHRKIKQLGIERM